MKDWQITAAGAAIGSVITAAVVWGGMQANVGTLKDDVRDIKTWKDSAIEKMGSMDAKLDALLQAGGVDFKPPAHKPAR